MSREFFKPVRRPSETFDRLYAGSDPAEVSRVAHATATALLARVRHDDDPAAVERVVNFTRANGIDDIADLWSHSSAKSLPGALWRLYVVQRAIHTDPQLSALMFDRGRTELHSIDPVVAGAESPTGPAEIVEVIDTILRGAFSGDFAAALDRAAACCRVQTSGATHIADDLESTEPERASLLTTRAARLSLVADEMTTAARLWRSGRLA